MVYSKDNFYKNGFNYSLIIAVQQECKKASHFRHVILHFTKYQLNLYFLRTLSTASQRNLMLHDASDTSLIDARVHNVTNTKYRKLYH